MNIQEQKNARKQVYDLLINTEAGPFVRVQSFEDYIQVGVPSNFSHIVNDTLQGQNIKFKIITEEAWPASSLSTVVPEIGSQELPLRDQAIQHARAAARLLQQAGCKEDLAHILWKEQDVVIPDSNGEDTYDIEYFSCGVCGDDHDMTFYVKKSKFLNHQFWISMEIVNRYHDYSFWEKVKSVFRHAKWVFWDKKDVSDFCLSREDSRKLKDVINRIPNL